MNWQQLLRADINEVIAWAETQSWAKSMSECAQDADWHSEGDVWTHTKMVCQQLPLLEDWASLDHHDRALLLFTALFHDSAKPLVSQVDPETGRITSPKHAVKGEHLARNVLRDLDCDLNAREAIAKLVRFHGRPAFLTERTMPAHEVVRLSWLVKNQLLYQFALADTRGRQTKSMDRPEENLQYWRLLSEEHDCYQQPYPFANDQARFLFFRQPAPNLHYVPFEDYSCTVIMMSGLPGVGKNHWLSTYHEDLPVIALDDLRDELGVDPTDNQGTVAQLAKERCRELLREKRSFAFNATNTLRTTRSRWIDLFADYGARIHIVYLEPPMGEILKRNRERNAKVPESVIRKLAKKVEPPTMTEAHEVTWAV